MHARKIALGLLFWSSLASAQISITPASLPDAAPGQNYYQELHAAGGAVPYRWSARGRLPPGITFDTPSATITGIPTTPGEYRFAIAVSDSGKHSSTRTYVLRVIEGETLKVSWVKIPAVANGGIAGEVEIENPGAESYDLTFIAVAVNEIGRATALGYQRFTLPPGKQRIPFGTTLPHGTYVVHADAVGEVARTRTIRRARLQTSALAVP